MNVPKQAYLQFIPAHSTWEQWNANFAHYYSEQHVPIVPEDQWQTLAITISGNPTFSRFAVPSPLGFANWEDWANQFTTAVNGRD